MTPNALSSTRTSPSIAHAFTEDQRAYVDATSAPDSHLAEQHTADSNNLRLAVPPD